jgi:hypothetical protein
MIAVLIWTLGFVVVGLLGLLLGYDSRPGFGNAEGQDAGAWEVRPL